MKYTILLLLAFSVCLTQVPDIDSIKTDIKNLNIKQEKIGVNSD